MSPSGLWSQTFACNVCVDPAWCSSGFSITWTPLKWVLTCCWLSGSDYRGQVEALTVKSHSPQSLRSAPRSGHMLIIRENIAKVKPGRGLKWAGYSKMTQFWQICQCDENKISEAPTSADSVISLLLQLHRIGLKKDPFPDVFLTHLYHIHNACTGATSMPRYRAEMCARTNTHTHTGTAGETSCWKTLVGFLSRALR